MPVKRLVSKFWAPISKIINCFMGQSKGPDLQILILDMGEYESALL